MLSGGAPYTSSVPLTVALGATCTLDMSTTAPWDGVEWSAPGFGQTFSLEDVFYEMPKSFEVQFQPPPPPSPPSSPPSPPSPPSLPPGIYMTKASLRTAVQAFNANPTAATATYGPIADWDVSAITDMSSLFRDLTNFNADISGWDTSSVTTMSSMFNVRSARALLAPKP
jgi:surface protein